MLGARNSVRMVLYSGQVLVGVHVIDLVIVLWSGDLGCKHRRSRIRMSSVRREAEGPQFLGTIGGILHHRRSWSLLEAEENQLWTSNSQTIIINLI